MIEIQEMNAKAAEILGLYIPKQEQYCYYKGSVLYCSVKYWRPDIDLVQNKLCRDKLVEKWDNAIFISKSEEGWFVYHAEECGECSVAPTFEIAIIKALIESEEV